MMRAALEKCRNQFAFYADEHRKAGKVEKAQTNDRFVEMVSEALEAEDALTPRDRVEMWLNDTPLAEAADTIAMERGLAAKVGEELEEQHAQRDRDIATIADLRTQLRTMTSERDSAQRARDRLRDEVVQARDYACELRGRLKEIRGNQMVRRGDLVSRDEFGPLPGDPYDDEVPF